MFHYVFRQSLQYFQLKVYQLPNKLGACEVVVPNKPGAPAAGVGKRLGVEVGAPKRLGLAVLPNKFADCCGAPKVVPNVGAEVATPKEVPA